jgi:hypothetical protein
MAPHYIQTDDSPSIGDAHRKVKAVSFGSFSLRLYKENETGCWRLFGYTG